MPEPASSFMVGSAPGGVSFAAPLLNFSPIGNYPQAYYQGQENRRQLAMANAFKSGVPMTTDAQGRQVPDVDQIINTGARLGGLNYVQGLLPYMLNASAAANDQRLINSPIVPNGSGNSVRPVENSATGHGGIRGSAAPQRSASPGEISMQGNGSMENPYRPKSRADFDEIPDGSYYNVGGATVQKGSQAAQNAPAGTTSNATGGGAPVSAVSGASGSPAPASGGNATETAQPSAGIVPNGPAPDAEATARRLAQGYDPVSYVQAGRQRALALISQADAAAALPNGQARSAALRAAAQSVLSQIKPVEDALLQGGQSQLEYGLKANQARLESGLKNYDALADVYAKSAATKMAGVTGAANQYENDLKPKLDTAQAILNDPRTWTGSGGQLSLDINKVKALFGDDKAAVLQEMLQKVTASSILSQINGLKDMMMQAGGASSSAGRIFQQQVDLMNKASPQLDTSLYGNRALVELERRSGEQSIAIRNLALDYLGPPDANGVPTKHRILDAGFDKIASNYLKTHPLFTSQELAHPQLLGSTTVPQAVQTKADLAKWAHGMQLRPGDAMRMPDGGYKMVTSDLLSGAQ